MAFIGALAEIGAGLAIEDLSAAAITSVESAALSASKFIGTKLIPGLSIPIGGVAVGTVIDEYNKHPDHTWGEYSRKPLDIDIEDPTSRRRYNMPKRKYSQGHGGRRVKGVHHKRVKLRGKRTSKRRVSIPAREPKWVTTGDSQVKQFKPGSTKSKKPGRIARLAKALQNLETLQGDKITHVEQVEITATTTGDAVGFTGLTVFTGHGVSENNGKDLGKMFCVGLNIASAGGIANIALSKKKLFLYSAHLNFFFEENGTGQAYITIYECVARKSLTTDEVGANISSVITNCLNKGLKPSNVTGATVSSTDPWMDPYMMTEFGKWFKVKKQTDLYNNATSNKYHMYIPVNRFIDPDQITTNDYIAGLSRMILIRYHGDLTTGADFNDSSILIKCQITYRYTCEDVDGHYVVQTVTAAS